MVAPAHDAIRGKTLSHDVKIRQAIGKQNAVVNSPVIETTIDKMLTDRGFSTTIQKAIDIYNVDIAIDSPPIAVEVFGGGWHAYGSHKARFHKRIKHLLDNGWSVVIIWLDARRYPFSIGCIDYIDAFAKSLRLNPSTRGQYRVILGNGKDAPISKSYLNTPADIKRLGHS